MKSKCYNCVFPAAVAKGAGPEVTASQMENVGKPRTAHRATILPKGQFERFKTHKHRFGTGVHVVWGVKPKAKAGPRGGVVFVHALLFDKKRFTARKAKQWLKAHDYVARKFEAVVPKEAKPKKRKRARVANVLPESTVFQYAASMNPVEGPKSIKEAIKLVQQHAPSPYARAYADAAMQASLEYGMAGLRVQVMYILSNLGTWRGELARETKKFMKAWVKAGEQGAKQNPSLMILMNPKAAKAAASSDTEVRLANKAFKSFHFKDSTKKERHSVPDNWPKTPYWILGVVDRFDAKDASGKTVSRTFRGRKPILAATKSRKDCFIVSQNGKLGIPSGVGVRIDYTVPRHSGRNKWSKRWWHPHESNPKVKSHRSGKHARITGPGLKITPRGIIG
jgi:hypothetical protein